MFPSAYTIVLVLDFHQMQRSSNCMSAVAPAHVVYDWFPDEEDDESTDQIV